MNIDLDGSVSSTTYALSKLQLGGQETVSVGADLTKISGPDSAIYYSDLVPTALVLDLQEYLSDTALLLERRTGTKMGQIPDLFLMANRELMEDVGLATGVILGFEDGYYKNYGARPSIYMRTGLQSTVVRRLLVHEYVHLVFDKLANGQRLAAWLRDCPVITNMKLRYLVPVPMLPYCASSALGSKREPQPRRATCFP